MATSISRVTSGIAGLPSRTPIFAALFSMIFNLDTEALQTFQQRFDDAGKDVDAKAFVMARTVLIASQQLTTFANKLQTVAQFAEKFGFDGLSQRAEAIRRFTHEITDPIVQASTTGAQIGAAFSRIGLVRGQTFGTAFGVGLALGNLIENHLVRLITDGSVDQALSDVIAERLFPRVGEDLVEAEFRRSAPRRFAENIQAGIRRREHDERRRARQAENELASELERSSGIARPRAVQEQSALSELAVRLAHVVAADEAAAGLP